MLSLILGEEQTSSHITSCDLIAPSLLQLAFGMSDSLSTQYILFYLLYSKYHMHLRKKKKTRPRRHFEDRAAGYCTNPIQSEPDVDLTIGTCICTSCYSPPGFLIYWSVN
jgi:hypothetical protein